MASQVSYSELGMNWLRTFHLRLNPTTQPYSNGKLKTAVSTLHWAT